MERNFGGLEVLDDTREQALFREHPALKAAVDAGRLSVRVQNGKTSVALPGWTGRLAKLHIPIDVEQGRHLEDFAKLEAQLKTIQGQIDKYPMLKEALEDGRAEIRMDHGNLGIKISGKHAWPHVASDSTDDVEKLAKAREPKAGEVVVSATEIQERVALALKYGGEANVQRLREELQGRAVPELPAEPIGFGF